MPLMDEFKDEREQIKERPFKERMDYFWEYYKWWVIAGVVVIIAIIAIIRSFVTRQNPVLYVAMVNTSQVYISDSEGLFSKAFLEQQGIDTKKNIIQYDSDFIFTEETGAGDSENVNGLTYSMTSSNYNTRQSLSVYIAAGDVDIISADIDWFNEYAYFGFFHDLRDILTPEQLEEYKDYIIYIDRAVFERYEAARDENNYEYDEPYPDGTDPEIMEDPIPVGIDMTISPAYSNQFITTGPGGKSYLGFLVNSKNTEMSLKLFEYYLHLN